MSRYVPRRIYDTIQRALESHYLQLETLQDSGYDGAQEQMDAIDEVYRYLFPQDERSDDDFFTHDADSGHGGDWSEDEWQGS